MGNPDLIEMAESEVACLIEMYHKKGLSYWRIMGVFQEAVLDLYLKAEVEYHMKGGN